MLATIHITKPVQTCHEFYQAEKPTVSSLNRIHTVLTAAGYRIAPLQDWDAEDRAFPSEDVERMAKLEHELWCQTQRANGWRWGPQKDKTKRTHPDLLPTDI